MKAIIVEDNPSAVNLLKSYLNDYPIPIEICGESNNVEDAIKQIQTHHPELLFLDIQLQDQLSFSVFKEIDSSIISSAAIIFITAYYNPDYIHQALKASAVDYILKPIDKDLLFKSIDKAILNIKDKDLVSRIRKLEDAVRDLPNKGTENKVPLFRVTGKIDYVSAKDILFLVTDDSVTRFHLVSGEIIATSKSLKFYEDLLDTSKSFFRISKQQLINLEHLESYDPKSSIATMKNKTTLNVSRRSSSTLQDYFLRK